MQIIEHSWNWNSGLSRRATTDAIVLHHAAATTARAEDIDRIHKNNGWSGIGYHYYVRKNGEIHRGRPEWAAGAHVLNHNNHTIGICAEGNYETETNMPSAQLAALCALVSDVRTRYPAAEVKRHRDYMATACPGRYYPFDDIVNYEEDEEMSYEQFTEYMGRYNAELAKKSHSTWAEQNARNAILSGLFSDSDGDGTLDNPQAPVTREQFAAVLDRAGILAAGDQFISRYDELPVWAKATIRELLDNGTINGGTDDDPDDINMWMSDIKVICIVKRMLER